MRTSSRKLYRRCPMLYVCVTMLKAHFKRPKLESSEKTVVTIVCFVDITVLARSTFIPMPPGMMTPSATPTSILLMNFLQRQAATYYTSNLSDQYSSAKTHTHPTSTIKYTWRVTQSAVALTRHLSSGGVIKPPICPAATVHHLQSSLLHNIIALRHGDTTDEKAAEAAGASQTAK